MLVALEDAMDNGDLFIGNTEEEDDKARGFISEEINRLNKIVQEEKDSNE